MNQKEYYTTGQMHIQDKLKEEIDLENSKKQ